MEPKPVPSTEVSAAQNDAPLALTNNTMIGRQEALYERLLGNSVY